MIRGKDKDTDSVESLNMEGTLDQALPSSPVLPDPDVCTTLPPPSCTWPGIAVTWLAAPCYQTRMSAQLSHHLPARGQVLL
jgi:hypothetical protein